MWEANIECNTDSMDTTRLALYGSYVEMLHLTGFLDLDQETFLHLWNRLPRFFKVFPRIRCLEWLMTDALLSRTIYPQSFINPCLTTLRVAVDTGATNSLLSCREIATECPALKALLLYCIPTLERRGHKVPCPITIFNCQGLVHFQSDVTIPFSGLLLLSRMPSLRFANLCNYLPTMMKVILSQFLPLKYAFHRWNSFP